MTMDEHPVIKGLRQIEQIPGADENKPLDRATEDLLVDRILSTRAPDARPVPVPGSFPTRRFWIQCVSLAGAAGVVAALAPRVMVAKADVDYSLEVSAVTTLGVPKAALEIPADSVLQIDLRPATRTQEVKVEAYLGVLGHLRPWAAPLESASGGVYFLKKPVAQIPELSPGASYELVFLLGSGGDKPSPSQIQEALRSPGRVRIGTWQIVHHSVKILAPSP